MHQVQVRLDIMILVKDKDSWGGKMGGAFTRKRTCVCLGLIHADVWQKPTQYWKAIFKKKKKKMSFRRPMDKCWSIQTNINT